MSRARGRNSWKGTPDSFIWCFFVFAIIIAAYSCRLLAWFDIGGNYPSYVRAALYLLLFVLWGYSLDQRIIQKPVLHCLRLMDVLMLIWLTLRTLKYEVVTDLTVARYLWYLYYLPILFIPLLGAYTAIFWENPKIISFPEKAGCYRWFRQHCFWLLSQMISTSKYFRLRAEFRGCRITKSFSIVRFILWVLDGR